MNKTIVDGDAASQTADEGKTPENNPAKNDGEAVTDNVEDPTAKTDGEGEVDYKKLWHKEKGLRHLAEKRMEQRLSSIESKVNKEEEEEIDLSKFDEETIKLANKIARDQTKKTLDEYGIKPGQGKGTEEDGMDKEMETFLDTYPEAYKHIEEIEEYRTKNPKMSYAKIYRVFIMDDDYSPVPKNNPMGKSATPTPAASTASDEANKDSNKAPVTDDEKAIEDSFNRFKGGN